jgi:4-hydroxythreonine-4-phosphate dehydrogenase
MNKQNKIIVGISIGDLNGIGSEIILKTFQDARMLDFCTPVIFASVKVLSHVKKIYDIDCNLHGIDDLNKIVSKKINVYNVWKEAIEINFGKPDTTIGQYAIKSLQAATQALKENKIDVLVTAPINKATIQSDTFNFPGHTDYLAKELGGKALMLMVSEELRVGLLTDHLPLKEVPTHITPEVITEKLSTISQSLKQDFRIRKPKIAVLGINPHNGDHGVIGDEDDKILLPTLTKIKDQGELVFGPYAADSFFGSGSYSKFDAIIASYHDQGLVPFKTLSFGTGVNYTAGLSKVRTSPDHGVAYDIAGKNCANHTSFEEAVFCAINIFRNRQEYLELTKNPLTHKKPKDFHKKN